MKIMMIASESYPYSKTGGLGDVIYALSNELANIGNDIRLFLPCTEKNLNEVKKTSLFKLKTKFPGKEKESTIYQVDNKLNPKIFLIHEKSILSKKGVYGDENGTYNDNCARFSFFCRACLDTVQKMQWKPDIIHTHDWPTALIPIYIKSEPYKNWFNKTKSVFSIHNLGYQGEFSSKTAHYTLLPGEKIPFTGNQNSNINLMQSALENSDLISTVSPTYAKEIVKADLSQGLSKILIKRKKDLFGILNGIDLNKWNPEKDKNIISPYSFKNLNGKKKCKKALLEETGLTDINRPLIAMITRFADQKGIYETFNPIDGAVKKICQELKINFIVVGTGEKWCEDEIINLNKSLPNFCGINTFNEELSHRVEAGSDFFLMPSKYEPCGLNQMYSSHYATVPIVRHVGGLADTVTPFTGDETDATGYTFYDLTPDAIYGTVKYAIENMINNRNTHKKLIENGMKRDFSWKKSAKNYELRYKKILIENL